MIKGIRDLAGKVVWDKAHAIAVARRAVRFVTSLAVMSVMLQMLIIVLNV